MVLIVIFLMTWLIPLSKHCGNKKSPEDEDFPRRRSNNQLTPLIVPKCIIIFCVPRGLCFPRPMISLTFHPCWIIRPKKGGGRKERGFAKVKLLKTNIIKYNIVQAWYAHTLTDIFDNIPGLVFPTSLKIFLTAAESATITVIAPHLSSRCCIHDDEFPGRCKIREYLCKKFTTIFIAAS